MLNISINRMKTSIVTDNKLFYLLQTILIVVTFIVFYPVLGHDFLYSWDDQWQVLNSYTFNGFSQDNLINILFNSYYGQYSPLNQFFYTCIYSLLGSKPVYFQCSNLLFHLGCVLLAFNLISSLLLLRRRDNKTKIYLIAFGVALLMGIHPVQVEAVSWISASKVLTCAFFFLLGLNSYVIFLKCKRSGWYVWSAIFFSLSFLCKEQAVIFPLCLLIIDFFVRCNKWNSLDYWLEKIPFFMLSVCFALFTMASYSHFSDDLLAGDKFYSLIDRLAFSGYSIVEYLTKLLVPVHLLYMYPFPIQLGESLPLRFWIYPFVLLVLVVLLLIGRKHAVLMFGAFFFFSNLLLVLHLVPMPRITIVADRYLYLANIGFFFVLIWYLVDWWHRQATYLKHITLYCVFILLVMAGWYSNNHCRIWQTDRTLKQEMKSLIEERIDDKPGE